MPDNLTDADLAAIQKRVEGATPGPWRFEHEFHRHPTEIWGACGAVGSMLIARIAGLAGFDYANGYFIAHARDDIPNLLASLRAKNEAIDECIKAMDLVARQPISVGEIIDDKILAALARPIPPRLAETRTEARGERSLTCPKKRAL